MGLRQAVLLLVACTESTGPRPSIPVTLCDATSHWMAYQNDGGRWTYLGAAGTRTFMATPRVAIARARFLTQEQPAGTASRIHVDYLTAEQAIQLFSCQEFPGGPGGRIGGSVAGTSGFAFANVYFNGIGAFVPPDQDTWAMEAQAVPATLLAARYDTTANTFWADRVIIRRDQSYLPGTPVPLIDFSSSEAFAPQVNTASFTSPRAALSAWYYTGGREHFLSSIPIDDDTPGSGPIYSIPATQLAAGDMHVVTLSTIDNRAAQRTFRIGQDLTLSIGPPLAIPTVVTVATQPYRRIRVELPSQPEYGAFVEVNLAQLTTNYDRSSQITMRATREYFGETPAVWSFEVPDFSGVEGFQLLGMFAEGAFGWYTHATNARFGRSIANAPDGEISFSASRSGNSP